MNKDSFIGMGNNPNPNVLDIPIGLGAKLSENNEARHAFESLNDYKKNLLITYIQSCTSSEDVKKRIDISIKKLSN